jgi:flagellar motor switch protein FliM
MLGYLIEPWENVIDFKPKLEKIETNPQFAQIVAPTEIIALITLSIKVGAMEGFMNFCLPNPTLEPIIERLNTKYWFNSNTGEVSDELSQEKIETQLEKTLVPVSAVIGKTSITVSDFINLQVGDIIPLDSYITSDIDILVGDLLKFHGKPGLSRGKNAIQITSLVEREEEA